MHLLFALPLRVKLVYLVFRCFERKKMNLYKILIPSMRQEILREAVFWVLYYPSSTHRKRAKMILHCSLGDIAVE